MRERLDLHWIGGQQGESRVLEAVDTVARRPSLAGYLNTIYPNKVQILGTEELSWLDSLDSRQRWEIIERLMRYRPLALVVSKDQRCPDDLVEAAEESRSEKHTSELQSLMRISYAVFCLKKKNNKHKITTTNY